MYKNKLLIFFSVFALVIFTTLKSFSQCSDIDVQLLKKIAIVFGESQYEFAKPLKNTRNDAADITAALRNIGFEVYPYFDTDKRSLALYINEWCEKIKYYDIVLFYYAGHGAEVNGENFLFGTDANPVNPSDILQEGYSANKLLERIDTSGPQFNIFILDACRNNPFKINWGRDISHDGLYPMSGSSTFIAFAAEKGKTASDGEGRNSPFTEAILKYITVPNMNIDDIFNNVNKQVRYITSNKQIPFKSSSLSTQLCLSSKTKAEDVQISDINEFASSSVSIDRKNGLLYSIDGDSSSITVTDLITQKVKKQIKDDRYLPSNILVKSQSQLYIIDSNSRKLIINDLNKKKISNEIEFENTPIYLFATNNFIVVLERGLSYKGIIHILNIKSLKDKKIMIPALPIAAKINSNILYISTLKHKAGGSLLKFDMKSLSIVGEIKNVAGGTGLGVSPEGDRLIVSNNIDGVTNSASLIDLKSDSVLQTAGSFPFAKFEFSVDGKYIFGLGKKDVSVIDTKTLNTLDVIYLASEPSDILFVTKKDALAWLPKENYFFKLPIKEAFPVKTTDVTSEDLEFQKLILNKDDERKRYGSDSSKMLLDSICKIFFSYVYEIATESKDFLWAYDGITDMFNEKDVFTTKSVYLAKKNDGTKAISTNCTFQLTSKGVIIAITPYDPDLPPDTKPETKTILYSLKSDNSNDIRIFVRKVFLPRVKRILD